jgi:predicted PurR-regulated permease PerM
VGGEKIPLILEAVEPTVRGAAYGVIATAAAQGTLAALGYYMAGSPIPLLLGAVTGVVALIPFGPPIVYLPVAAYLSLFTPLPWYHAVGLALWGTLVVSGVDNVLRPLFISQATSGSPILVFIGVLGGVLAFGLLGVFAGPAIIAVAQLLWRDLAYPSEVRTKA